MDKNACLLKIKKLLALSENNPSFEEANAAALKAQQLMLQYNIAQEELKASGASYTEAISQEKVWFVDKKRQYHHNQLALIIAKNFRCKTFYSTSSITFLGFEADAKAAAEVFKFTIHFMEASFKIFLKEDKRKNRDKYEGAGASFSKLVKRNYISGFIEGLRDNFKKQAEENQAYSLMVVTPGLVQEAFDNLKLKTVRLPSKADPMDFSAVSAGYTDGKRALGKRSLEG